jgi:two-component system, NarL family, nitrate/nitrite response regulator NarL
MAQPEHPPLVSLVVAIRLYRDGIARALAEAGFDVREAVSDLDGLRLEREPDVLIVDAAAAGSDAMPQLRSLVRRVPVIALGVTDTEDDVIGWVAAGVAGLVTRDETLDDLVRAVRGCLQGEAVCTPRVVTTLFRRLAMQPEPGTGESIEGLTPREREVASLLREGRSNREIAARLGIEMPTVKNHVRRVLDKLGVAGRAEAAAVLARRN